MKIVKHPFERNSFILGADPKSREAHDLVSFLNNANIQYSLVANVLSIKSDKHTTFFIMKYNVQ